MDPAAFAARLEAERDRLVGTDAERRAAALCAAQLRTIGRAPRLRTLWFRRQRDVPRALHAVLGVAGSVVSVQHHPVGLGLAAGALALALLDAAGVPLAALPFARRATQNVVAPPIDDPPGAVRLVLVASVHQPRDSMLARLGRRVRGAAVPGPAGLLDVALAAVAACAGARLAGAGGTALGAVQLVPSVVLIALFAGYVEAALSARPAGWSTAGGAAAALAVAEALDRRPPRRLAVELLIAGAGDVGMRAYVRGLRRLAPEDVVVLYLAGADGALRFARREGERFAPRLHPRLAELAADVAEPWETRDASPARVARGARWPALTLTGPPAELAAAALRLVSAIDAEVGQARASGRR